MENSVPEQAEKGIDGWGRKLSSFFSTILMLIIASFAVVAISEIAARESILSMLTGRITTLKSEFVEQNRNLNASTDPKLSDSDNKDRRRMLEEIKYYESLKRSLNTIIALGSKNSRFSLRAIRDRIFELDGLHSPNDELESPILQLSSDQLLAIAVMACAAMGAMITTLRGNSLMTLRALSLGIATGFVVYLAIKGGKHVFLMQMQGEIVPFNPYGCAFAGLLAGLFTEKAYQLLAAIVNEFFDRFLAASTGKKGGD